MTIPVDCPHCEARFQLNPDLLGKSMRCPECREVFEVRSAAEPPPAAEPPSPLPPSEPAPAEAPPQPVPTVAAEQRIPSPTAEPAPIPAAEEPLQIAEPLTQSVPAELLVPEPAGPSADELGPVEEPIPTIDPVSEFIPTINPMTEIVVVQPDEVPELAPGPAASRPEPVEEAPTLEPVPEDLPVITPVAEGPPVFMPVAEPEPTVAPVAEEFRIPPPEPDDPSDDDFALPPPPPARPAQAGAPVAAPIPTAAPRPAPPKAGSLPAPKEVRWSGDAPPVQPPPAATAVPLPFEARPLGRRGKGEEDDEPYIRRRPRARAWPKVLLAALGFGLVVTLILIAVGLARYSAYTEERLAQEAESAYKDGNYGLAQTKYEQLAERYSDSDQAGRYRFFAALSAARSVIGAVTTRENFEPGQKAFARFVEEHGQEPLAQPETGYGADVVQAGRQLADAIADHAGDRLKEYREGLKKFETHEDRLAAAERAVEEGRKLLPTLDKFRDKETSLEPQRKRFDDLSASFAAERHRLAVLAPFRDLSQLPTADRIEEFQTALRDNKLTDDAEAQQMLRDAEKALRDLIGYRPGRVIPAVRPPVDPARPVLFAAPVAGSPEPPALAGVPPDVVFALARGVLYALDAQTGKLLWGSRVAPPTADPRGVDLPTRISVGGEGDRLLMAEEIGGKPGLTSRVARTGELIWYQPLPFPPAGRPVAIGGRVYLPLRDPLGTVYEFDTATGGRTGELALRQPVGGGVAVLPGPGGINYLYVPGDRRRVFVFEVGREDADGNHLDPRCVLVMLTEHPRDSLRGEPVLISPALENGPRYLILEQTDGPQAMKLRAFPLPPPETLAPPGSPPSELTPKPAEIAVPGWAWFPAQSNGERVVLATDAGAFLAFGVNQAGNADAPLFALPAPKVPGEQDAVARSQVVAADEDAYWAVLGGQLVRLRTSVDPVGGLKIIPQGGRSVGEPVNRPQVRPGIGLGVVVVRPGGTPNVQAVGFDLQTGQIRWQRRLGVTPAGPPVVAAGSTAGVVADEDGGAYAVDPAKETAGVAVAEVVGKPFADLAGRAVVAGSADGRTTWVLAPEKDAAGQRLRVRCVSDGRLTTDTQLALPDQVAGAPVALGNAVLLPLVNGYVYRFAPGGSQLEVGPLWKGEGGADAACFLSVIGEDEFLATDGGRRFYRWRWPAGAKSERRGAGWEMRAPIAVPPAAVREGSAVRFAAADANGAVFLFDADKPGPEPVRRWRGGGESAIPAGKPTDRLAAVAAGKKELLVYSIDRRHLVALDPAKAEPAWVAAELVAADAGELTGWAVAGERVIATDQAARVVVLSAATGEQLGQAPALPAGTVAVGPAVPVGSQRALVVLADGSAVTLPLPGAVPKK